MELTTTVLPDGIRLIGLKGRLDIEGAGAIDLKFTVAMSAERAHAIVDLSGVDFLASIGIATLVRNAKAARARHGNMIFLNPQPNVARVLASTRIDQLIEVCYDLDDAVARVKTPPTPAN
jgi:anti-sigma B factor antagonist